MKKILTLIVCAAALVSCGSAQQPTPIKVISYNIRMSAAPDADGDNRWENRKQASINMINDQQPTLLGLQEACPDQVAFLDSNLPDYKRIGVIPRQQPARLQTHRRRPRGWQGRG